MKLTFYAKILRGSKLVIICRMFLTREVSVTSKEGLTIIAQARKPRIRVNPKTVSTAHKAMPCVIMECKFSSKVVVAIQIKKKQNAGLGIHL